MDVIDELDRWPWSLLDEPVWLELRRSSQLKIQEEYNEKWRLEKVHSFLRELNFISRIKWNKFETNWALPI